MCIHTHTFFPSCQLALRYCQKAVYIAFWSQFSSFQSLSPFRLFATPWTAALQAFLSITNSWSLLKLMSIKLVMPSSHLILCCPSPSPPALNPSQHQGFYNESVLRIRWPKYWSFSFNISPSNEYSGWFPLGWIDWISLQSKGLSRVFCHTTVQKHQFFCALPFLLSSSCICAWHSFDYTELCRQSNISPFKYVVRFVIAFLRRSKHLLISWLQSLSTVILEPKKIKSVTVSIVSPSICHEEMGPDAMIFVFWMLSFKPAFHLLFHLHQEALEFLFAFCHKHGVNCIYEVIDISPCNLDSSLCFIQPGFFTWCTLHIN